MNITSRQLNIIKILLGSSEAISSMALSQEIGCSTKTIQSEIKDINKLFKNGRITSIRGVGYKIEGSIDELNLDKDVYNDIDRVQYILREMLKLSGQKDNTIKLEDLADSMYVSLSTIKNDIKEVKLVFDKYYIEVAKKHKQGLYLNANEEDIIKAIVDICNKKEYEISVNDFLIDDIKNNIFGIKKILLSSLEYEKLIITDAEFKNMFNYILISLSRNNTNEKEKYIKKSVVNYKKLRTLIINNDENKDKIINSIKEFCKNLKVATSIDISEDKVFEECLYNHISNMEKKLKLGINQSSISAVEIKLKYPFAFELAKIAKKTIEKNLSIEISEDEVANIALHVGGALERASYNDEEKVLKTIIVCTSGIGTSMLIKAKLENIFKDKLEIKKIIPSYLIDYISAIDIDFVISTVPLEIEDIPVINISPMLTDKEIKKIEKYIENKKIYEDIEIKDLFDKELFFTDIKSNKKEDIIDFISNELLLREYIDEEMKNSYSEREKIATTEIGNMVCIPHGANGKIYESKIAVGILEKPVKWELGEVRLVIMLAVDKDKILDYEELFLNIYRRVDSIAKVISICENKNYDKFLNMFK